MPGASKDPARLRALRDLFFWIGFVFVIATLSVVGLSNTSVIHHLEQRTVPLSWILAGVAVSLLFVAERCNSAATRPPLAERSEPEPGHAGAIGLLHSH